jgi:hypothetical protein
VVPVLPADDEFDEADELADPDAVAFALAEDDVLFFGLAEDLPEAEEEADDEADDEAVDAAACAGD